MTSTIAIALLIVLVALVFDFTNGFHDAANSIATVVSTRVLSPRYAVIWAAIFNFVAFAIFGTRVAKQSAAIWSASISFNRTCACMFSAVPCWARLSGI